MTQVSTFSRHAIAFVGALCLSTVLILAATPILPIA